VLHFVCTPPQRNEWSPLYLAARNGHLEVVQALVKGGANANQADKVGKLVNAWATYAMLETRPATFPPYFYQAQVGMLPAACLMHAQDGCAPSTEGS